MLAAALAEPRFAVEEPMRVENSHIHLALGFGHLVVGVESHFDGLDRDHGSGLAYALVDGQSERALELASNAGLEGLGTETWLAVMGTMGPGLGPDLRFAPPPVPADRYDAVAAAASNTPRREQDYGARNYEAPVMQAYTADWVFPVVELPLAIVASPPLFWSLPSLRL